MKKQLLHTVIFAAALGMAASAANARMASSFGGEFDGNPTIKAAGVACVVIDIDLTSDGRRCDLQCEDGSERTLMPCNLALGGTYTF